MANMKVLGKRLGRNHALAAALWDTGVYEARMVTSFVDEPARAARLAQSRAVADGGLVGCALVVLNAAAVAVARRLAAAPQAAPRWVGKDAVRELT